MYTVANRYATRHYSAPQKLWDWDEAHLYFIVFFVSSDGISEARSWLSRFSIRSTFHSSSIFSWEHSATFGSLWAKEQAFPLGLIFKLPVKQSRISQTRKSGTQEALPLSYRRRIGSVLAKWLELKGFEPIRLYTKVSRVQMSPV